MTVSREDPRFWDVRTIDRRVRRGQLNKKDYDKHLKALPDVADKGQVIELKDEDDFDDIDDEPDEPEETTAAPSDSTGDGHDV